MNLYVANFETNLQLSQEQLDRIHRGIKELFASEALWEKDEVENIPTRVLLTSVQPVTVVKLQNDTPVAKTTKSAPKRLSLPYVNEAIKHTRFELVKGPGYFYLDGHGVEELEQHVRNAYVFKINDLSIEQWISHAEYAREAVEAHEAWEKQFQ